MQSPFPRVRGAAGVRSLPSLHVPAAVALAAGLAFAAGAQAAPAAQLGDTVVTATRTPQPLADLVADVSIVDRETIESSGATGVADVLARVPGVEISRNGGPGTTTSVYLRGAEQRFTAVFIDGVRMDSQTTGGAPWEAIPLGLIDRIEVLRGPAAAVYGSDAVGGVIQIFTRKGEGPAQPYVGVGAGSHGTYKAEAGVSGSAGEGRAVDYALGFEREISDGFNARPIAGQNPDKDGLRRSSVNARVGLQIDPRQRLEGTLAAADTNAGYDTTPLGNDDRALHRMHALGLNWRAQWSDRYTTRVSVTDSRDRYETRPSPYLTDTRLRGYLFQNEWREGGHLFTAALERREDELRNGAIDGDRSQDALALGYGFTSGPHALQFNARHDSDSEFGGHSTGSIAYGYAITPQWRATASAGTSFRAPTLYQRFSPYGVASLKPEEGRNTEVGLRWAQGASSASVVAYRNRVKNLIVFGAAGPCQDEFGCYANAGRARYQGVTLSAQHALGGVQLRASLDLQNHRDEDTGRQLARRAKRHATLGADTRIAGWTVGSEVQSSGRRFDNAANTFVLGGYTLVNLYASTRVGQDTTLLARVDNLTDKDYQTARTYAQAGRTFYVGLKWAPR
ncbi:TonB-dependent receptor [Acidovorax sp. GBBC 3334]|uniref:TonB-dependent receptor domain-containing protein n=1 Tax=Acidovorax sp. GBBC 3334 TaxID=2940496 RepID=UPI0023027273|nr:TonB-dependent receptor [Acidovorax sp. GBBC 3334]MDA8454203.1 TonB-dependent receptor [Acidovorax sp. GBBC 3334]